MAKVVEITREQYDCLRELGVAVGSLTKRAKNIQVFSTYLSNGGDATVPWHPPAQDIFSYQYVTLVDK